MKTKSEKLIESYIEWLRDRIEIADVENACEITTPFLDRHNDQLQIYVERSNGKLRLSDDSYILGNLETSGVALDTPKRREMLQIVLNGFGVQESDGELFVEASTEKFPQKKHSLIQAMLAVDDMFMTARPHVTTLFLEDVESYLDDHDIRFSPSVQFTGKTGFLHKFDFVIPSSRIAPERLVRAINKPSRDNVTSILFSWTDTKDARPRDSKFYVMLNDEEKPLPSDLIDAFMQYDVDAIPWSEREKHAEALAA